MDSDLFGTIKTVGAALIMVAVLVVVLSTVFGFAPQIFGGSVQFEPAPTEYEHVTDGDDLPDAASVSLSDERQVILQSEDAYVDDPVPASTWNGSWALALTPTEGDGFNEQAYYTLYAAENETVHLTYENGSWTARYNDGGQSAVAQAPASRPIEQVPLVAAWDDSSGELRLYVDGTLADTATLTSDTVSRGATVSWRGGIDEIRTYNATLDGQQATAYADQPVAPTDPANATGRLMFNENQETVVYYAAGSATFVGNTTFGPGVAGPDLEPGADYEFRASPVEFRIIEGTIADGAPVVFITYESGPFVGVFYSLQNVGASALVLIVLGLVVLAANVVWQEFGGGGF